MTLVGLMMRVTGYLGKYTRSVDLAQMRLDPRTVLLLSIGAIVSDIWNILRNGG